MDSPSRPLTFLLLLVSDWVNRQQEAVIDYLLEENRILRAAHASRRLRLTDDQRRRLAVKGGVLGRPPPGGCVRDRDTRHDPAVVPEARRSEIRRFPGATPGSPVHQARHCCACGTHGEGESDLGVGPIQCRERLGGVLKFYYREAA